MVAMFARAIEGASSLPLKRAEPGNSVDRLAASPPRQMLTAPRAMPGAVTSAPIPRSARARRQELGRGSALPELERRTQHGRDLVGELLEGHAVAALPQVDSAI